MKNVIAIPVPIYDGRITLRDLRALPEGTFLISNVRSGGRPAVMVTVRDASRDEIFSQIKEERLQGRLFYGFRTRQDYERWSRRRAKAKALR